jgi:hypothetical protein
VKSGNSVTATVFTSYSVCRQGPSVSLHSSNPSIANVPSSVNIAAGQKLAPFVITTAHVRAHTSVTISASVQQHHEKQASNGHPLNRGGELDQPPLNEFTISAEEILGASGQRDRTLKR